jgi:pseudaminic acid synthase
LQRALKIVEIAAKCGANAIKLQTYTADTMTLNIDKPDFRINDKNSLWNNNTLYELYKRASTPWKWHRLIMDKAKDLGLDCFSSPFDSTAVDFLESLNVPAYKIASFESTDLPLIKKVAATKKPLILSTGLASKKEIDNALKVIRNEGCKNYILLKCTSNYPADPKYSNLKTITDMKKKFKCNIGLSDHTLGIGVAISSIAYGAVVIEKHFTLDRNDGGVDSVFSLDPSELKLLVSESISAWKAIGNISYGPTRSEISSLKYRRSIYVTKDLKKGEILSQENIRVIRPSLSLNPKFYEKILGKKIKKNLKAGSRLSLDIIS